MKLLEKIVKNSHVKTIAAISAFYLIANMPAFISTYIAPQDEIKSTLAEQIKFEMDSLKDISGGAVYVNFRLLGSSTGYIVRKLLK